MGGQFRHRLTVAELAEHTHTVKFDQSTNGGTEWLKTGGSSGGPYYNTGSLVQVAGGNETHNIMQPYLAVYIWQRTA